MAEQAIKQYEKLLSGVSRYERNYKPRDMPEMPTIWQQGSARLLDYGVLCPDQPVATVLLVPSLINRYYVLDLSAKQSFARYLASQNIYPIVLDWGEPSEAEQGFAMADYVTKRLLPAIDFCAATAATKLHLLGYCLGGVLTLAAAQLTNARLASLALLATPWDFHAEDVHLQRFNDAWLASLEHEFLKHSIVPAAFLQSLFMLRQPFAFSQKFTRFADCANPREAEEFLLLEQWVNDGVGMTSQAATDCLIHWIQKNQLQKNQWRVGGKTINGKAVKLPCFFSIPKQDVIVPYGCANSLATEIPNATITNPTTGHVGMIVGSRAKKQLWEPYVGFVNKLL